MLLCEDGIWRIKKREKIERSRLTKKNAEHHADKMTHSDKRTKRGFRLSPEVTQGEPRSSLPVHMNERRRSFCWPGVYWCPSSLTQTSNRLESWTAPKKPRPKRCREPGCWQLNSSAAALWQRCVLHNAASHHRHQVTKEVTLQHNTTLLVAVRNYSLCGRQPSVASILIMCPLVFFKVHVCHKEIKRPADPHRDIFKSFKKKLANADYTGEFTVAFPRHKNIYIIMKCAENRLVKQRKSSKPAGAFLVGKT